MRAWCNTCVNEGALKSSGWSLLRKALLDDFSRNVTNGLDLLWYFTGTSIRRDIPYVTGNPRYVGPGYYVLSRSQVADGEGYQVWREAGHILSKKSQFNRQRRFSQLWVRVGAKMYWPQKIACYVVLHLRELFGTAWVSDLELGRSDSLKTMARDRTNCTFDVQVGQMGQRWPWTHLVCVHGSGTIYSLDFVDKEISDGNRTTYVSDKL